MLPDKNELNNELIEHVSGGEDCDRIVWQEETEGRLSNYICPNCGRKYMTMKKRTDGYCLNCEPMLSGIPIPTDGIQSTMPISSVDKKIIKIH